MTTWSWCQVEHLRKQGVLSAICERVRFARRRLGHYEVIDFLAVLFGYAISGERALEVFYEGLQPLQKSVIIRNITHARANAFSVET